MITSANTYLLQNRPQCSFIDLECALTFDLYNLCVRIHSSMGLPPAKLPANAGLLTCTAPFKAGSSSPRAAATAGAATGLSVDNNSSFSVRCGSAGGDTAGKRTGAADEESDGSMNSRRRLLDDCQRGGRASRRPKA